MSCWNRKTLLIVAVGAVAVLAVAPSAFGRLVPLLVVLACPVGMLVMMGAAGRCGRKATTPAETVPVAPGAPVADAEIAGLRREVTALRADLERQRGAGTPSPGSETPHPDVVSEVGS